ncbi:hypothetical protein GDO86_010540 [Hymenochirus boettgeri]|uniref:Uncharacterized protein n=1 Tax=Hymenochirus boettgeri TaxID=247094 RepID=A0A8T2JQY3_9PIPI|nr:hypothetical protein GDO86_010540 [Hymenochirus boettgeri]
MFVSDWVFILLTVLLCLIVVKTFYRQKKTNVFNYPPGPKPLPIIGNLHIINMKKPYKTYLELSKIYGPVFSIHIGMQRSVVLCGHETVKDALIKHAEEFSARPLVPIFHDAFNGYGIVFSNGESWKAMRRFALSALRNVGAGKTSIENIVNEECDFLVEKFKSYRGTNFKNNTVLHAAVGNIILSILIGHRFDYDSPTILRLISLVQENIKLAGSPMALIYNVFPSVLRWLPGSHNTFKRNEAELKQFIEENFIQHKKKLDKNDQMDLIDVFLVKQLEKNNKESHFHVNNLIFLAHNMFIAGTDSVSTTLQWGILFMIKYPKIQMKVQKEIEKVIGSNQPQLKHKTLMPYTNAVIHEIQRFADVLPLNLPRSTTQDLTFRGYFLPKGTVVIPLLTSVLNDKDQFERPDEFYPQHFLDSEGNFVKKEAFIPFSAGERSCTGENLAKIEIFLFFTRLLQNFTFQVPPGTKLDLTSGIGFTTPPILYDISALPRA